MDGAVGAALVIAAACLCASQTPVAQPEAGAGADAGAAEFESADELLRALEAADRDLRALTADIRYIREFFVAGDRQTRDGRLYFLAEPGEEGERADRRFAIDFDQLVVGRRVEKDMLKRYVFDGQWLLELDFRRKHFTRRQVVPPGEAFDPLRIGEGPFPIPIGQRRQDILSRFEAELLADDAGLEREGLIEFVEGMSQIRLEPRPGWEEQTEFVQIRLWYERRDDGRLLPRMARTVNHSRDEATVILKNIKVNDEADVPEAKLDTSPPGRGWDGQVLEWRGERGQ